MKTSHHAGVQVSGGPPTAARPAEDAVLGAWDTWVEAFANSMPERYRYEFGPSTVRQHARIAAARGRRPVHADLFTTTNSSGPGLCVVAPDVPGLLAIISAGLLLNDYDIARADAYTRKTPAKQYEAVDLFWVRRSRADDKAPLGEADAAAVRSVLRDLMSNRNARQRLEQALSGVSPGESETSVRFRDLRGAPWLTLEIESNDCA